MPGTLLPSALLVVALIAVSGGLHIDGVADSADAFMSSRDRDTMLTIMKDSRVGAMGALTLTGLLLIKFAALASLPSDARWPVMLLTPLAGRVALVLPLVSLPYARPGGLATLSHQQAEPRHAWLAASLLLVNRPDGAAGTRFDHRRPGSAGHAAVRPLLPRQDWWFHRRHPWRDLRVGRTGHADCGGAGTAPWRAVVMANQLPRHQHGGNLSQLRQRSGTDSLVDFSANLNPLGPPEWLRPLISAPHQRPGSLPRSTL